MPPDKVSSRPDYCFSSNSRVNGKYPVCPKFPGSSPISNARTERNPKSRAPPAAQSGRAHILYSEKKLSELVLPKSLAFTSDPDG